jgi:outer membrane protein OmpA-like peptidoglycan-associated protein
VLLVLLLALLGFVAGGRIGATQVPADAGFAGGPTVLLWGCGGALVAAVAAMALSRRLSPRSLRMTTFLAIVLGVLAILWVTGRTAEAAAESKPAASTAGAGTGRIDYLDLANGAIPIRIGGAGSRLGASFEQAIRAVDGNPAGFVLTLKPGTKDMDVEFVYELPALTRFDHFAVPNVTETPSPSVTFTRAVEIRGSASSPTDGFVVLASATLSTHRGRGEFTEITPLDTTPVRWVSVRLTGGIQVQSAATYLEFSEIVGNGTQDSPVRSDRFHGAWQGRGVRIRLAQDGPVVTGCYDVDGELTGTVTGNLLRAVGTERTTRVQSTFILSVRTDGTLLGVRSSNRAPFTVYAGNAASGESAPVCPSRDAALGCGSIIHGIAFDFDSAVIRPDSEPVLARLFQGLKDDPAASIVIEGHTSSEGTDAYNLDLSKRRAEAVLSDLVKRGIAVSRLKAAGIGETRPIASNNDENGRSLNRRVEVNCR